MHHRGIDRAHVTDKSEQRIALIDTNQTGVFARQAHRVRTVPVDTRHDLAVDLPDERHAHDVDGFGVGDATAVDKLRFFPEPSHEVADLRSAAVYDDRIHPDQPH